MSRAPLLSLSNVSKRFGATLALDDVSFDLMAGEVHALMGENGAGKSTLMKILAGVYPLDSGSITLDGQPVTMTSPRDAATHGIAIIHQELNTLPAMTVAENLAIGREPTRLGALNRRRMVADARDKLARIGSTLDPRRELGQLSVGMQQMVEIARAVSEDARILVLDEPTASLSRTESKRLFDLIADMKAQGMGLIYISHRMEEVWQLADRVTVFRDGRLVGSREKGNISPSEVVRMMVGRDVDDLYTRGGRSAAEPVLQVEDLSDGKGIGPVSLEVRAGEVVCLSGLIGAGRTETARMIFGADKYRSGTVRVKGQRIPPNRPRAAIRAGMGMVPESRKEQALFLELSVKDNIAITSLADNTLAGVVRDGRVTAAVRTQMERLRIRSNALRLLARSLSGGNQQKLVIARWLLMDPVVLVLDEPTRGVDIGAKSEIYALIQELTERGIAILVISSDLPEALGISDRILVMRAGLVVKELDARSATEEDVMKYATGITDLVGAGDE
jgi:ribose transport system ATP-binding protein